MTVISNAFNALSPSFLYRLNETTGTSFANTNATYGLPLTKLGTPTMGSLPVAPAGNVANDTSIHNTQNSPLAERADNGLLDRPTPGTRLSIVVWCKPTTLETGATQVLVSKASVYKLWLEKSAVLFSVGGSATLDSGSDVVVPDNPLMVAAVHGTTTAELYLQASLRATRASAANPTWTNATKLEVGGITSAGTSGFLGYEHLVGIWYDRALTAAEIRTLYETSVATEAEIAGVGANVFNWSRQVLASDVDREYARITNVSDSRVDLTFGATATIGGGRPLYPGDYWETPNRRQVLYTGAVSAIHHHRDGVKRLALEVT